MSDAIEIIAVQPDSDLLEALAGEAREEGYSFVDRALSDARLGQNRFDKEGEYFVGAFADEQLIGCGGVSIDPYSDHIVGRLRHVFVLKVFRRQGVASKLVRHLLDIRRLKFETIRLRTPNGDADRFYEALGFQKTEEKNATHIIRL